MIFKQIAVLQSMNRKIEYLFPIELYIIIKVRFFRLELGILPEELSLFLDKNKHYIGNIESSSHNGKYNDTVLNKIAAYFTDKAKELETADKTEYTIYDFYPTEILSDNIVIKVIPAIPKGSGPTGTLNALIEATDFFDSEKTLKEIVNKANEVQNQSWQGNNFTQPLENSVKKNRLKLTLIGGQNNYTSVQKTKKD